jgi:hypothetical protein
MTRTEANILVKFHLLATPILDIASLISYAMRALPETAAGLRATQLFAW